jgi:hypothetical protein
MSKTAHEIAKELATGFHGGFAAKLADAWFAADSTNQGIIEKAFANVFRRVDSTFMTTEQWVLVKRWGSEWEVLVISSEGTAQGRFDWELKHTTGLRNLALVRLNIANEHLQEYANTLYKSLCESENGFETVAMAAERVWRYSNDEAKA